MVVSVHGKWGGKASTTAEDGTPPVAGASPVRTSRAEAEDAEPREPGRRRVAGRALVRARSSLYVRVVAVNAAVLAAAAAILAFTPATVSSPVALSEALVLAGGVVAMVVANAILLRGSFRGLEGLVQRMDTLDVLRPRERLPLLGGSETQALIEAFNRMLERLESERRASTRRTLSALEGERRRIGQELHDEIGQRLTGILLQLARVSAEAPEPLDARLGSVSEQARAALDEVGALAWQLRPGVLDDLGLLSGLRALVETFEEQSTVHIEAVLPDRLEPIAPEVELAIYRIAQEGLSNALRHAAAQTIELDLSLDDDALRLVVADDGGGIAAGQSEGPGIRGMRERALLVGGRLRIDSPWGRGVRVRLDVPRANLAG
jgi:two-component system sensor histidine kinase UhpB